MILKVKEFQTACKSILEAVDTTMNSIVNETLELKVIDNKLYLNVTNREYFVTVVQEVESQGNFVATVDAKLFLTLIAKITTDEVEITTKDNSLVIKGNGSYKLPMIYDDAKLLELKPIVIDNPTSSFVIPSDILLSILNYNTKEMAKGIATRPVQKMYYVDEQGCITFTNGACVNAFRLPQPVKLLLGSKLVKLFKLFAKGIDVQFTLGYDGNAGIIQPKVRFATDTIEITSILSGDESMLLSVPVNAIRGRANNTYAYSINISKDALIESIDRLMLFSSSTNGTSNNCATFEFTPSAVTIYARDGENKEVIGYNDTTIDGTYTTMLNLADLKITLESCQEQYLTMHFGDTKAFVIARGNIKNVVPEVHLV